LNERRPAHRYEAKERHHKHVAEPVVRERKRAAGVCEARGHRGETDDDHGWACDRREVDSGPKRERERDEDPASELPHGEKACLRRTRRPKTLFGVCSFLEVKHVIREVRCNLNEKGAE
jgi:hypothetical protein